MRILLVSDIHANRAALDAVREHADVTLCLGDLVEYGVDPAPCIAWTKRHSQHWVRGNHDHGSAHGVKSIPINNHGYKYLTSVTRPINRERMSEGDRGFLAAMPLLKYLTLGGMRFLLVHATPRDPLDEYAPPDAEFWVKRLGGVDAEIICVGHTHRPYVLEVNGRLVVNPGSVGLQRDGDPRASYAILNGRDVSLHRVEYNTDAAVQSLIDSPLPENVKQLLTSVYRDGKLPDVVNGHPANETAALHPL